MPRAALSTLLLLSLATATVADCPSSAWVQFQGNCYTFLQVTVNVESIEDVRNQCIGHGNGNHVFVPKVVYNHLATLPLFQKVVMTPCYYDNLATVSVFQEGLTCHACVLSCNPDYFSHPIPLNSKNLVFLTSDADLLNPALRGGSPGADMISIHNEEENAFILDTLQKQWKGPDDLLLGMFYDTDDASFKWFDNSNMTFDKWADQDGEDLVDTCGFLYTKTGEWKKGNCEISSVEGTLCKATIPYDKKYLSDNHILISTLVVAGTVTLTVLGAIIWFLYKRNACSGFSVFSTALQSPYNDDCALVVADDDYAVQLD